MRIAEQVSDEFEIRNDSIVIGGGRFFDVVCNKMQGIVVKNMIHHIGHSLPSGLRVLRR